MSDVVKKKRRLSLAGVNLESALLMYASSRSSLGSVYVIVVLDGILCYIGQWYKHDKQASLP